jgi:hypothetical protein
MVMRSSRRYPISRFSICFCLSRLLLMLTNISHSPHIPCLLVLLITCLHLASLASSPVPCMCVSECVCVCVCVCVCIYIKLTPIDLRIWDLGMNLLRATHNHTRKDTHTRTHMRKQTYTHSRKHTCKHTHHKRAHIQIYTCTHI